LIEGARLWEAAPTPNRCGARRTEIRSLSECEAL